MIAVFFYSHSPSASLSSLSGTGATLASATAFEIPVISNPFLMISLFDDMMCVRTSHLLWCGLIAVIRKSIDFAMSLMFFPIFDALGHEARIPRVELCIDFHCVRCSCRFRGALFT